MPSTPGRPCDPTLHPRTKPEGNEFAFKNRATGDWFRHDGKNIEQPAPVPVRLATKQANEIAERGRGLPPDQWFEHDPNAPRDPAPRLRCKTDSARQVQVKVYGKDEPWYKHDENVDFYGEPKRDRVASQLGANIKEKYESSTKKTMDWYKHEHGPDDAYRREVPKSRTGPLPAALENKMKLQSTHGTSNLFQFDPNYDSGSQTKSRLTMKEAEENFQRDQVAGEWYEHDDSVQDMIGFHGPRVASQDGQDIALKNGGESTNWYENNQGAANQPPRPRASSEALAKHCGGEMQRILRQEGRPPGDNTGGQARTIKPEVQEFAHRSVHGVMDQVLDQDANRNYDSPRPAPRAVRPEAEGTFAKNKGVMGDCLQGYLPPPWAKSVHKARPADDTHIQKHTGSVMDKTIKGELPSSGRGHAARTIKPEAEDNAERNRGTMQQVMMHGTGSVNASSEQHKGRGLMTEAAQEIARKYHGTVSNLIS